MNQHQGDLSEVLQIEWLTPYASYIFGLSRRLGHIYDINAPRGRQGRPTQANSEFLINRQLGDWGESMVRNSIPSTYVVVKYGRASNVDAGEPGFREHYSEYQRELSSFGKRPDLLVFRPNDYTDANRDLSESTNEETLDIVKRAIAGIEVRSSNFLSRRYRRGESSPFDVLSFTVKVEDIRMVVKWVENTGVPHYYLQVPFDEVYGIGFHKVLEIASNPDNEDTRYAMAKDSKNQFKTTVKVPFTEGVKIGDIDGMPTLVAERKVFPNGRVVHYVRFTGSRLVPLQGTWEGLLREASTIKDSPPAVT